MKATRAEADRLVSKHFELLIEKEGSEYQKGQFEAYELISKGYAILDVMTRPALNKFQKEVIVNFIKEL